MRDIPAVECLRHRLPGEGDRADGSLRKIERCPLIGHEAGVEWLRAAVAAVVADYGEPAGEGGAVTRRHGPDRIVDRAIKAAAALQQEAAVPVIGQC